MATLSELVTNIELEMTGDTRRYLVSAKQGDKATRFIVAKLRKNGEEYTIPAGVRAIANIEKPDGKHVYNTCTYSGSEVTVELTNQALAAAGTAYCDIEIRTSDNTQIITSVSFTIEIERTMRNDNAILSSNEFTELEDRIEGHIQNIDDTEEAVRLAESARATAENERVEAESARASAEQVRQQNERTRVQQEAARQLDTAQAVEAAGYATEAAVRAKEDCETVTQEAEEALQNQEQLEETLEAVTRMQQAVEQMEQAVETAKAQVEQYKEEINTVLSTLQAASTHTHSAATTSAAGFMSASDKSKLDGIATGANYVAVDGSLNTSSYNAVANAPVAASINDLYSALNNKASSSHTHSAATSSAAGFMSASDKSKLDGIASGANKTVVDSALSSSSTNPVQNKVVNSALSGKANSTHTHSVATTSADGFMSASDKSKLDGIADGANKTVVDSSLSPSSTNPVRNSVIYSALQNKCKVVANISNTMTVPVMSNYTPGTYTCGTDGTYLALFWVELNSSIAGSYVIWIGGCSPTGTVRQSGNGGGGVSTFCVQTLAASAVLSPTIYLSHTASVTAKYKFTVIRLS